MEATQELDMMKDGARRVQEFLEKQGVNVKHSVMLEALSAGFGSRNWRTVREKLNAPSAPPALTLADLDGKLWEVHAIYEDNDQPYTDYYQGNCAMEAAVEAQIERRMNDEGSEIFIVSVIDRLTRVTEDHCQSMVDAQLYPHATALHDLGKFARTFHRRVDVLDGASMPEEWLKLEAGIRILEDLGPDSENFAVDDIDEISRHTRYFCGAAFVENARFLYEVAGVDVDISGSEAVETVLNVVLAKGIKALTDEMELRVYHAQALLKYARHELDYMMSV